jgi:hypothetical protein
LTGNLSRVVVAVVAIEQEFEIAALIGSRSAGREAAMPGWNGRPRAHRETWYGTARSLADAYEFALTDEKRLFKFVGA